jgi:hypothetical protein
VGTAGTGLFDTGMPTVIVSDNRETTDRDSGEHAVGQKWFRLCADAHARCVGRRTSPAVEVYAVSPEHPADHRVRQRCVLSREQRIHSSSRKEGVATARTGTLEIAFNFDVIECKAC